MVLGSFWCNYEAIDYSVFGTLYTITKVFGAMVEWIKHTTMVLEGPGSKPARV